MRPFSISGIDHIVLRVADLDASLRFYEDILGCRKERELPDLGLYQLRAGRQLIDLVTVGSKLGGKIPVNPDGKNQDHFCLTLDTFDEDILREWLSSHGIEASEVGERYGAKGYGLSVYIQDPDGNTVELKADVGIPLS
ncbi:MAG: VOC family protein [Pseudomonadales bacterium]|nr:VOC family protein [Pseudomonadales bacterium]MBO6565422.1 VOC family protein [Pseudomonadales bacterium]MBO6595326.1 VOC family protein [Pseudomonadales bacterium]MBO6655786.1 VOC family protein [Pseudomonadales bacterium]MBO6701827.1 VOC family protein [Pseudomonadales bacterium]